jgi:D-alanyl-D-alanine carboxypeptidase/D-alanyl-D-alanine-endopeptidase (penicillin-binding protein 4)
VTAICVGDNLIEIIVSSIDGEIRTSFYPQLPELVVRNMVVTGSENRITTSVSGWEVGPPVIALEGTIKQGETLILYRPFPGPPRELLLWLSQRFEDADVEITGVVEGTVPTDTNRLQELAMMYSDPMQSLLVSMNKWSRNIIAEQVMRTVAAEVYGAPGSTEAACDMLGAMIDSLAPTGMEQLVIADGSGLSRLNRLAPIHLVALLEAGTTSAEWGPEFLASLPVNGRDGTLSTRMEELPEGTFRGKTGTLSDTCTIAGVLITASGRMLYVAIMLEIPPGQVHRARDWQDSYIAALYADV